MKRKPDLKRKLKVGGIYRVCDTSGQTYTARIDEKFETGGVEWVRFKHDGRDCTRMTQRLRRDIICEITSTK